MAETNSAIQSVKAINSTIFKPVVGTIYATELQTCTLRGIPYPMREHSTLNEKFGIQSGVAPAAGNYPKLKYLAIGNKGHRSVPGKNGVELSVPLQHTPRHAALFNHIPWVAREPNNDLTPQEREKFALRNTVQANGKTFVVYYLRRLYDESSSETQLQYQSVVNNGNGAEINTVDFVPTATDLSPEPEELETISNDMNSDGSVVNVLNGDYLRCASILKLRLTEWDLNELKNAANILYGDERYAVISEIALVSAVDKVVEASSASGNFNYKEVICAQCCAFVATDFRAYYQNKSIDLDLNLGAVEPMFRLAPPTGIGS